MATERDQLEVAKLRHDLEQAHREARRPWLLQIAVPALVASIASGAGGYMFGESAAEKARAEVRAKVIEQYFSVDNEMAGKRRQMLAFIEMTLGKDDPDLASWARKELSVVDEHLTKLSSERDGLTAELEQLQSQLSAQLGQGGPLTCSEAAATSVRIEKAQLRLNRVNNRRAYMTPDIEP